MIPAPPIDELARRIHLRRVPQGPDSGRGPYVLFVGAGCSRAAGAPTNEGLARAALRTFGFEPNADAEIPADKLLELFEKHTARMSPSQFGRMVRTLYANVPVPSFYFDLAALIREQYFPLILTTNFDTLLEQALTHSGVRVSDYQVTTFDRHRSPSTDISMDPSRPPLTHIVKLHGDLAQNTAFVTPDQIDQALRASRHWIKSDLAGDMIMIGHAVDPADPINRWLSVFSQRELWWIDSAEPPPEVESWASQLYAINGDVARPGVFLSQLALRLLRAPDTTAPDTADPEQIESFAAATPEQAAPVGVEALGREILRNESVLYNLQQESNAFERSPQLQAQIIYQKRQIARLCDRARDDANAQGRIAETVDTIVESVHHAASVPKGPMDVQDVVPYVENLRARLRDEFGKTQPNHVVVSALLGATLVVADRIFSEFGPQFVKPDDLRRLASYVPIAAGKAVI